MSALPPKAAIADAIRNIRFVPMKTPHRVISFTLFSVNAEAPTTRQISLDSAGL
jgi:hypothetical protein